MTKPKTQIEKFRETARELGSDESETAFDSALRKVATHRPKEGDEPKKSGGAKKKAPPNKR